MQYFLLLEANVVTDKFVVKTPSTSLQEKNCASLYTFRQKPGQESTPKKRFMLMMVCCFAQFMQHSGCSSTKFCGGQATCT